MCNEYHHMLTAPPSFFSVLLLLLLCGCGPAPRNEVIVYASLDREFSEPILHEFETETKITVAAKYDVESTKTVGLTNAIVQESAKPRCDLFWNNEILNTIRLEKRGLLETFSPPNAAAVPESFRSPRQRYYGFAARARVLLVNTELTKDEEPTSIRDLTAEQWRGKCGFAKPLAGTTATHAAVLFATWGDAKAAAFFKAAIANGSVFSGNKQVAEAVGRGQIAFGLTDTDDAIIEVEAGRPVKIVFPDQEANGLGALFIPNTLCIVKNGPNTEAAKKLADFLLRPEIEARLAEGPSAQIPILASGDARKTSRVEPPAPVKWMAADFATAEAKWEVAGQTLRDLLP